VKIPLAQRKNQVPERKERGIEMEKNRGGRKERGIKAMKNGKKEEGMATR
jgi:hypothetical protein